MKRIDGGGCSRVVVSRMLVRARRGFVMGWDGSFGVVYALAMGRVGWDVRFCWIGIISDLVMRWRRDGVDIVAALWTDEGE